MADFTIKVQVSYLVLDTLECLIAFGPIRPRDGWTVTQVALDEDDDGEGDVPCLVS